MIVDVLNCDNSRILNVHIKMVDAIIYFISAAFHVANPTYTSYTERMFGEIHNP